MSTLYNSDTFVSGVLGLLIFIGLNQFLPDHLFLILPVVYFLRFLGILGRAENWNVILLFHGIVIFCLLSSWNACIFCLKEGNGITFLLHGDTDHGFCGVVFSIFIYALNCPCLKSTSTVSVDKQVLIDPEIKSQMELISIAI